MQPPPPRSGKVLYADGTFNKDWHGFFNRIAQGSQANGVYSPTFQSGYVQYAGPGGAFLGNTNFIFGLSIPNPSGINAPCLLLGSGVPQAWIITDTWGSTGHAGINLGIAAGETFPGGTDNGGELFLFGGASDGGTGGTALCQGGTSASGQGGEAILHGGNSTSGLPGDAFVIAGETGSQGGNVHLIATQISGIPGDVRLRINSTILMQFLATGEIFLTLSGTGSGTAGQKLTSQGPGLPAKWA